MVYCGVFNVNNNPTKASPLLIIKGGKNDKMFLSQADKRSYTRHKKLKIKLQPTQNNPVQKCKTKLIYYKTF